MNPYNPLSNIQASESAYSSGDYERMAEYHLDRADTALQQIAQSDPLLATHLAEYVRESILAINAYHHDIFSRANPTEEDVLTRIRKNR